MKIFYPNRLIVFIIATISLANFFEAGRIISTEKTFSHVPFSVISLLIFVLALLVMGYWVYSEEKEKNNLKIKFGLYEWFYKRTKEQGVRGKK